VRELREGQGIKPVFKLVDTCAAEFESMTPYLYSTYDEEDEAPPTTTPKIIILGSGPNRIGQGIEFDYCCCHAAFALKEDGYETIMVNCNPETVSTDYDTSDRLYFEPLARRRAGVYNHEAQSGAKIGMIVQFGGQTPLNLAQRLRAAGVPIIGTSPESIDLAEDRKRFGKLLRKLRFRSRPAARRPAWKRRWPGRAHRLPGAGAAQLRAGRPRDGDRLRRRSVARYMKPGRRVLAGAAGPRRSLPRDASKSTSTRSATRKTCHRRHHAAHRRGRHSLRRLLLRAARRGIREETLETCAPTRASWRWRSRSSAWSICSSPSSAMRQGNDHVFVIEVNPRASRTVPYVSKATGMPLAKIAARLMTGRKLRELLPTELPARISKPARTTTSSRRSFPWSNLPASIRFSARR
jgi:carbamoyl-phosphate synthase large subunit